MVNLVVQINPLVPAVVSVSPPVVPVALIHPLIPNVVQINPVPNMSRIPDLAVALSGSGALTSTAVQQFSNGATLSGAGVLSVGTVVIEQVPLAGSGALSTTASAFGVLAAEKTYSGTYNDSYLMDLSSTNAVTLLFDMLLPYPTDGGTHIAIEYGSSSGANDGGGFFLLTESEFHIPNVIEMDSNHGGGNHDLATCPRPTTGATHKMAWVIDRTQFPCHSMYIDGVQQTVTAQTGYSNNQVSTYFGGSRDLNVGARQGDQLPANVTITSPPLVVLRALTDAEAVSWSTP